MWIKDGSNPDIHGGNAITDNDITGVRVEKGPGGQAVDPAPIVRESDLFGNSTYDYYSASVGPPLQASGNWWGTADPVAIAANIRDSSDSVFAANVQWTPFLNASSTAGGTAVPGSYLNGPVVGAVQAGVTHMVVGDLLVESGQVATLEAGAHLQFLPGMRFLVDGTLDIAGSASQLVHLESAESVPAPGDWDGIYISASSVNSQIRHALIEHGEYGVNIDQATVDVSDSQVRDASAAGIYLSDSSSQLLNNVLTFPSPSTPLNSGIYVVEPAGGAAIPDLIGNTIQDYRYGIRIRHASTQAGTGVVSVTGNTLEAAKNYGLYVEGTASPLVTGNLIRNNTAIGIVLVAVSGGYPTPTIQGNDIHDNGASPQSDLSAGASSLVDSVDASKNWWGTTDPVEIADKIKDRTDTANRPVVGFTKFLDGSILANGQEVQGNYVTGPLVPGTTFSSGTTYVVTGVIDVPVGGMLTVESGATLSFLPNTRLEVAGTLDAQGGLFTSANTVPGQNDWEGIQILPGSTGSVLDGIIVEWAKDSVEVDGADADITNSTFREFGLGGITYRNSATGTISNNTVHQGQQNARGIEIVDSSPTVTSNTVSGIGTGIDLTDASPLITGNTIDGNKTGISIHRGSSPTISGLNLIQNNTTLGVLIQGNGSQVDDPAPVLTGNDIKDNGPNAPTAPLNLKANTFGNTAVNLDAKLNYWGTDVETEVLAGIDTSSASSPSVDSIPYLKADGTPSGSSNLLNETLTSDLTLPLGTTWSLVGDLTVPLGWTLTIEPGVTIKASPGTAIDVSGTLDLQGTSGNRIRLESAETVPTSGSWEGIFLLSGSSGSVIAYADILHARHGVDVNGAIGTVSISETDFIDFGRGLPYVPGAGIRVENALAAITNNNFTHSLGSSTSGIYGIQMVGALAGSTITGNLIRDLDHGIHLESNSDPAIQGNTIQLNSRGIHVTGASSPVIDGANVITLNDYGIYIVSPGASSPTISGNDILENDTGSGSPLYNVFAASGGSHEIEAGNNWWGVQTASEVAAGILDATDGGSSRPYVDAVPFLDASVSMGGVPVTTSNFLGGFFPTGVSSLTADTSYEAVGSLVVPVGATLTIPEGATISMTDDASFLVEGILQVAGVSGNRVTFSHPTATAGSWAGIVFESTSVGSTLNEVLIQDAQRAVWVRDVDVAITEAEITNFGETGIWIDGSWTSGPTVGTITGSWIHNSNLSGTGIYLTSSQFGEGASPAITNTRVEGTFVGIHMAGKSSPHITASTITGNRTGIQLFGQHNVDRIPAPVVNDSNIFDNVFSGPIVRNLEVKGYFYEGTSQVLDFKRNWWGSTSLAAIQATIEAPADPQAPVIDLSDLLNAENGASIPGPIFTQLVHTVTRSVDGFRPLEVEDVTVDFVLAAPAASVDVNFYEGTGFNLGPLRRTIHITGAAAGPNFVVWDGKDDSGGYVASDGYTYTIDADGFLYAPGPWFVGGPPVAPGVQWADSGDPGYNTYRNEFWHRDLEVTGHAAEITLRIKRAPNDFFDPWPRSRVVPPGTHTLVWDGRDDSGIPVEGGPREIASNSNSPLRYNLVVVEGTAPLITGTSPHIEVKADPWLVTHSYEQISKLTYRLDQDSHVTIKVLPPGIYDPDDPSPEIQTLVDNVLQPAESGGNPVDYVVPWTGLDPADTDGDAGNNVRVDSDGHHTFTIEATSDVTGFSTVYRGSLQIQR
ncbi:MAG: hypothetical protein GY788_04930 [bacterium]|nr:hypothetical protein [bacterium]